MAVCAQMSLSMQAAGVMVPAAVYFLLLGLLNSRPTPQLVRARTDFIVLVAAFSPLLVLPAVARLGPSVWSFVLAEAALVATIILLAPRRRGGWALYNVTTGEALRASERALRALGRGFEREGKRLRIEGADAILSFSSLPLLRNVSIAAEGADAGEIHDQFERGLADQLAAVPAAATATASAFLMIAVALLAGPLALFAHRMPEMVRLITTLVR